MLCCEVGKAPSIGRKESSASIPQIQRRHALDVTGVNAPVDLLQGRLLQILAPHLAELKDLPDVLRVVEGNQVGAIPVLSVEEFNRAAVGMPAPYRWRSTTANLRTVQRSLGMVPLGPK